MLNMSKTNFFNETIYFKSRCAINYRLNFLNKDLDKWILINKNIYLSNDVLSLIPQNSNFNECLFKDFIETICVSEEEISFDKLIDAINRRYYFIFSFDTFNYKNNRFYKKFSQVNTGIIYGYKKDKFQLYMAKDILGSQFDQLNFSELKEIFLKEPKKRETEIKFSSWGLPFSYITKIPFNNKIKKENVYSNFLEFFDQNNELKNIGAINYLSKNIIEICKKIKIERRNYDCIDIFLFLYDFCLIQKRQVEFLKLSDLIEIINCILQNIELCKLLYARYIFKDDENYLIKIKERFDTIQIKYLELYDKMKANSQRFKKLI